MQRDEMLQQRLARDELLALRNRRTGITIFQVSWIMAFVCLAIVNWQLRFSPEWQAPDLNALQMLAPGAATAALLASASLARRGLHALQRDDLPAFLAQWKTTLALGAAFALIIAAEWLAVQGGSQYVQVFRLMTGFHLAHALVIGAFMVTIYGGAQKGQYGSLNFWDVEAAVRLWYFVVVAWLLFYVVIYWI